MEIKEYHVHLYYKPEQIDEAKKLGKIIEEKFQLSLGRFHEKPVGPHPMWSCGIGLPAEKFGTFIPWLSLNRGHLDCLIHPLSGDDLLDHSDYAMWLGKSYTLKISSWVSKAETKKVTPKLERGQQ